MSLPRHRTIQAFLFSTIPFDVHTILTYTAPSDTGWFNTAESGDVPPEENHGAYPHDPDFAADIATFIASEDTKLVIDFGTGSGAIGKDVAKAARTSVLGIDGHPFRIKDERYPNGGNYKFVRQDLTAMMDNLGYRADWLMTFQVAEHIPPIYEHVFLANILAIAPSKGIIINWAPRGMPGTGHVNCRDDEEVHNILRNLGFIHDKGASDFVQARAKLIWNKVTNVFRRPSSIRRGTKSSLIARFDVVMRDNTKIAAIGSNMGNSLRLWRERPGMTKGGVSDEIWVRKGEPTADGDLRGVWLDGQGREFSVSCYTVRGPPDDARFAAAVIDACIDLSFVAYVTSHEQDRACWAIPMMYGTQALTRAYCCQGHHEEGNCFGETHQPGQCCLTTANYPCEFPYYKLEKYTVTD